MDSSSVDREHVDVGREYSTSKSIVKVSDNCRDKVSEGNGGGKSLELLKLCESIARSCVSEYRGTDKPYKCVCDDRTQNGVSAVSRQTVVFLLSCGLGMVMSIRNYKFVRRLNLEPRRRKNEGERTSIVWLAFTFAKFTSGCNLS